MNDSDRPMANPTVVLREEFDDWAVLFDPDTGDAFGLNPVSVYIWKQLDGEHTLAEIVEEVRRECDEAPADAGERVAQFVDQLVNRGLAGYEFQEG